MGWAKPHAGGDPEPNVTTHFLTPPVEALAMMNVETRPKIWKYQSGQTLREDVHKLRGHRDVQDPDITNGNAFSNEVEVDLDILRTLVLNEVGGEVDCTDIVVVDETALWQCSMELLEELPEPTSFDHAIGHGAILSLDAWSRDDVLTLGGPRDKVVTEEYSTTRGGLVCIQTIRPVSICVDR
jgi:hypothetical protein